jgi:branched-subunit amino acid transport protein
MLTTNELILIIGMFLVTFAARYPLLVLVGRITLPESVTRALRYVPVAVLTAICATAVFMPKNTLDISISNAALIAAIVSILIAWRTKNLLLTIGVGMVVFLAWRALFPVAVVPGV